MNAPIKPLQASSDYYAVLAYAQEMANTQGRECGIEKMNEFGRTVFVCKGLPRPENRCGWELRCEVVRPMIVSA